MESRLIVVEIAEDTRKETEERLLRERHSRVFFVHMCQDHNDNGKNFVKVMNLSSNCISVVFDHIYEEAGEGIDGLERVVDGNTRLDANAIEEE